VVVATDFTLLLFCPHPYSFIRNGEDKRVAGVEVRNSLNVVCWSLGAHAHVTECGQAGRQMWQVAGRCEEQVAGRAEKRIREDYKDNVRVQHRSGEECWGVAPK
jgi:hypothetical protein